MARFNTPVPIRQPDTVTHEGGQGFTRGAKDDLFVLGLANFVAESTFYESGTSRDDRFESLVRANAAQDPDWTREFIVWMRSAGQMRTASIVAAAEYIAAGAPNGRQLVSRVLQRADEPAELIGYWFHRHGRNLPMPLKRGIAAAVCRLYTERSALRYDGAGNTIRFGDVIDLTHPHPQNERQSALFRYLLDRRHNRPDPRTEGLPTITLDRVLMGLPADQRRARLAEAAEAGWDWQRIGGWVPGGMDAAAWEAAIPNMGLMALTRNLRNFDELKPGLAPETIALIQRRFADPDEVVKSRQFPLRYLTAWKNISSVRWGPSLETALNLSLANVPTLPGRTLILIDVSQSMEDVATTRRSDRHARQGNPVLRWEAAFIFGLALAQRAEKAETHLFSGRVVASVDVAPAESILRLAQDSKRFVGGGTDTFGAMAQTFNGQDRIVIITDEQTGPSVHFGAYWRGRTEFSAVSGIKVPVYTWNLGGYGVGHSPIERNWYLFGGLTDAAFQAIPMVERRAAGRWPWEQAD